MSRRNDNEKPIDHLTQEDYDILAKAQHDATWFTDFYLKSPYSGTYWRKNDSKPENQRIWEAMKTYWINRHRPLTIDIDDNHYEVTADLDGEPVFFHNHGQVWQPWQLQAHHATQDEILIVAGVGTGKTKFLALSLLTLAATIPNFIAVVLAMSLDQAKQTWDYMLEMLAETEYYNRWVHGEPTTPYPRLIIKNDFVGESQIRVRSLQEHSITKILTFELDALYVDQAELFMELNELRKAGGTRLRGRTARGRPRLRRLCLVANSDENPEMWALADKATIDPDHYLFLNPETEDNPFLTREDIAGFRRKMSNKDDETTWFKAKRPKGKGIIFTHSIVSLCESEELNKIMDTNLGRPGFIKEAETGLGLYHWDMPYEPGRYYVTLADPGQANPPDRNSPVIMTWDVSDFPQRPMVLRAFNWVFGNGNYWSFINEYMRYVREYHTQTRNGFDSTGIQKSFDQLVFSSEQIMAEGLDMSGTGKYAAINAAKFFMGKGLMQFPYIEHLNAQFGRYKIPEPEKLAQDLVMTICMSAWYVQRYYWLEIGDNPDAEPMEQGADRYMRYGDRR